MKRHLALILLFVVGVAQAEIYISVSGATVKKAKFAMGAVHPAADNTAPDPELAKKVSDQVKQDIDFINLFDSINPTLFANADQPKDYQKGNYETFASLGASFALKMAYKVQAGKLVLEALLFDVPGKKKIFGTRYQYPANQYQKLVHVMSEDILKAVTGERGLFNSRIVMVCRETRRKKNPPKEVYIADTDGRNMKQLTGDETLSLSPSWHPNGKSITYTQFEWRVSRGQRKKGTVLKRHDLGTGNRTVLSAKEGMNSGASWSPDGNRVAMTLSYSGRPEIYLVSGSGGDPEPFSRGIQWKKSTGDGFQQTSVSLLFDVEPSWAPDGKRLVMSSARTGHPMIYVVDVAGRVATQLTFAGQYNASPAWSPKGDRIVFAAQRLAEGNFDLYMIDPDGNNLTRLTIGDREGRRKVNSENPSWAPTGRHIAYGSNDGGTYGVWVMSVDGQFRRKISPPDKECTTPSWGPVEG